MRDWPREMMTQTGCWCSKWVTRSQSQSSRDQAQALTQKTVQRQSQRLSAGPESTGEAESKQSYSKGRSGKWKGGRGGWIEETWLVTLSMNSRGWQRRTVPLLVEAGWHADGLPLFTNWARNPCFLFLLSEPKAASPPCSMGISCVECCRSFREGTLRVCACVHVCVCVCVLSHLWLFETLWTVVHQAPLSMGSSRQAYWSGLSFSSPGDLPDLQMEPGSPAFQVDSSPS